MTPSIAVRTPLHHSKWGFLVDIGTAMKKRVYVKDARQVPRYAVVKRGENGGLYYETEQQERAKARAEGRPLPGAQKQQFKPQVGDEATYKGQNVKVLKVEEGRLGGVQIEKPDGSKIWVNHGALQPPAGGSAPKRPQAPPTPKPPQKPPEPKRDPGDFTGQKFLYNGELIEITGPGNGDMWQFKSVHGSSRGHINIQSQFLKPYDPEAEAKLVPKSDKELQELGGKIKDLWKASHKQRGERWDYEKHKTARDKKDELKAVGRALRDVPGDQKIPLIIKNTVGSFKVVQLDKGSNKVHGHLKLSDSKKSYELREVLQAAGVECGTFRSSTRGISFPLDTTDFDTINGLSRMKVEGSQQLNGKKFTADRKVHNALKKLSPEMQETVMSTLHSCGEDLDKWGVQDIGVGYGAGSGALGLAYDGAGTILLSSRQFSSGRLNAYTNDELKLEMREVERNMKRDYGIQGKDDQIRDGSYLRNRAAWDRLGNMRVQTQWVVAHELGHQVHFKLLEDHPDLADEFTMAGDYVDITKYAHQKPSGRHGDKGRQPMEPFAECYAIYKTNPGYLKAASPRTFAFMKKHFKEGS